MRTTRLATTVVATALLVGAMAPAQAKAGDVVRRGDCSARADWTVEVGLEDGRLEVEGEVDSNRSGQVWRWRIRQNGSLVAGGTRSTSGASGSFEVPRLTANLSGTDTVVFRARRPATGEVCRGVVTF